MYPRSNIAHRPYHSFAAALFALLLVSCSSARDYPDAGLTKERTVEVAQVSRVYRLGIGDKLKVTVFGEENLSGTFEVDVHGQVSLPLIGDVAAKDHSIRDFRDQIRIKLAAGYLREPRVSVEVLNYRSFFVHGEVRASGEFKYKTGLTIRDAVAMAGGYTYRANKGYIYLVREGAQVESEVSLPSNLQVLPGDNLRVPERFF